MSADAPLTDAELARLVALAAAATPGRANRWVIDSDPDREEYVLVLASDDGSVWDGTLVATCTFEADAAFIAACDPVTVRRLVARTRTAEAERDAYRVRC